MKKLILAAALVACSALTSYAQDAQTTIKRYMDATNLKALDNNNQSMMFDMTTSVEQGGQKMLMPIKIIQENPGNKMRVEMEAMGQKVLLVINGKQGWMQTGGVVTPLPEAQLSQMAGQNDVLSNMKWDASKFTFEYLTEKDGVESIKITPLDPKKATEIITANFVKATGLLQSINMKAQAMDVKIDFTDYKAFGDIKLPTVLTTSMNDKAVATMTITKFEVDFPTAAYMFVEPK